MPANATTRQSLAEAITTLRAAGFRILVESSAGASRWLRVADVASRWSVSPVTVRRMVDRGELAPVLAWSSELRISVRAVEQWEREHMRGVEREERNVPQTDTLLRRPAQKGAGATSPAAPTPDRAPTPSTN